MEWTGWGWPATFPGRCTVPRREHGPMTDLQTIPGVGPAVSRAMQELGIARVSDLHGADPQDLYDRLAVLRGVRQDPCVLYVFRCAVYFAERRRHDPDLLKWWNWKDRPYRRR